MNAAAIPNPLTTSAHRLGMFTLVASTCTINVLSLVFPIVTLQIYDRVLHSENVSTLQLLAVGVAIGLFVETLLRMLRSYLVCYRGASYAHGVSCSAMTAQLNGRVNSSRNRALAGSLADFSAIKNLKDFTSGNALITAIDLMFLPVFILVMASISKTLVLVPVGLLCLFALLTAYCGLGVRQKLDRTTHADDKRYDFLIESLTSIQLLKAHATEKLVQRRFERLHRDSCISSYELSRSMTQSFVHGTVLNHLMTVATVAAGAYLTIAGSLTIGALIAVVQLSSRLMQPVQKAVLLWLKYQDYQSARVRAETLFDVPTRPESTPVSNVQNSGRIEITGMQYRESANSPLLLENINLTVQRGETLVINGVPGSGKTTLLKMVAGIYAPTAGTIRVNDVDVSAMTSRQAARVVGYLSPRPTLFRGSIRDNITRFGDVPLAQTLEVARLLGVSDEFARLPRGIDTVVGNGNESALPPGLTQMVANLRVLASKPRVILYDEADTGLDNHYYNLLLALIGKLRPNVAMIIVSRDMNIRQLGQRQATLADGRLVLADSRPLSLIRPEARM